jgi:pyruvate kinase
VVRGGMLGEKKGINLPGVAVSAPSVTGKDVADLRFGLSLGVDYVAQSFVRSRDDVLQLKQHIQSAGKDTPVIAKIERPEALTHFEEILDAANGIMVARGDLGIEVDLHDVPQIQKDLITRCNHSGIPVITATQMLESMMANVRPTRAEVTDVANAIYDGTDAVMLSGETAMGQFPVEAVRVMASVAAKADEAVAEAPCERSPGWESPSTIQGSFSDAIGRAVREISELLAVKRIVCFTMSGYTAAMIARYRPRTSIIALTLREEARRRCALYWGVEAARSVEVADMDSMVRMADDLLVAHGLAEPGDVVIFVAGTPLAVAGRTNLLKLHTVGDST